MTGKDRAAETGTGPTGGRRYDIICFSGVDWDSHWQRPHHLMRVIAGWGHRVIFVDNLGVRLPRLRDLPRVGRRLRRQMRARNSLAEPRLIPHGIRVHSPLIPPLHQISPLRGLARSALRRRITDHLSNDGERSDGLIVWTYLPLPIIRELADGSEADLLVYDWADDASEHMIAATRSHRRRVAQWEDQMAARADLVFMASTELHDRRRPPPNKTFLITHGSHVADGAREIPVPIASIAPPRIGFVGSVSDSVDVELLDWMARQRPNWNLLMVGPVKTDVGPLNNRNNVHMLGEQPHERISSFMAAFDVAVVPYRLTPATLRASSIKLREYLAHGLPVVSVDFPDARHFEDQIEIASDRRSFLEAVERCIGMRPRPRRLAELETWDGRAAEMLKHVEHALGAEIHG